MVHQQKLPIVFPDPEGVDCCQGWVLNGSHISGHMFIVHDGQQVAVIHLHLPIQVGPYDVGIFIIRGIDIGGINKGSYGIKLSPDWQLMAFTKGHRPC